MPPVPAAAKAVPQAVAEVQASPPAVDEAKAPAEPAAVPLRRWREVIAKVYAQAYARGRAEGERAARARLEGEVEQRAQALEAALEDFWRQYRAQMAEFEAGLIDLALAVAERILGQRLEESHTVAAALLERAAAECPPPLRARLHPDDLTRLEHERRGAVAAIELVADPMLAPGDVIVETAAGTYDLRIASQLRCLVRQLEAEVAAS